MSGSTLVRIGQWNSSSDAFGAHPACPTGAIYDLNDGTNWSLEDANGKGNAINWGNPVPTILESSNPRTVGARVTRRVYNQNRKVQVRLFLGQATSYTTFNSNLHNLVELCEGITADQPAALLLQPAGSSTPLYADVLEAHLATKVEELMWLQLVQDGVMVEFTCRPFLRGNRQWLQNLVVNPGFEAPSGPGVQVFNDVLTNTNAYSVQAGGALTQNDKNYYSDLAVSDAPLRYYRLDEASGTTANDARASGNNGTIAGGVTLGTSGLLNGDTDKAMTFNGSTGVITASGTGLPTGNNAVKLVCWFQITGNPGSSQFFYSIGTNTSLQGIAIGLDSTGHLLVNTPGVNRITSVGTISFNTRHCVVVTWDGTTLTASLDGASVGTATGFTLALTYATTGLWIGTAWGANFFAGILDEVSITAAATGVSASTYYAAGNIAPSTNSASAIIPANGRISFGSSTWGAINTWQIKFRYFNSLTGTWYLHYTDANNYLAVTITSGTNSFQFVHVIGGVTNTLAQATVTLVNEVGYFVQITQFPVTSGVLPSVQAILAVDNGSGSPGTTLNTLGPIPTSDAVTALSGAPQMAATGTGLTILQNQVSLFGPGGWWWKSDTGTGTASGAWQQNSASTYPSGPVTSNGAAISTAAPAGTFDGYWASYNPASTATIQATAYPIGNGVTFQAAAYLTSTGLANSCAQSLRLVEFDSGGNLLRSTTLQSVSGNQASWTQLAGSVATGASCAYVGLQLRAVDATNASVNGSVTWDNGQWWNQTQTGMAAMPYCELRFPQSPAQLVISGLVGDVTAPCAVAIGTQYTSLANGVTTYVSLGRRGQVGANAALIAWMDSTTLVSVTPTLDSAAYGGYNVKWNNAGGLGSKIVSGAVSQLQGVYHLWTRYQTNQSSGNLSSVKAQLSAILAANSIVAATTYPVTQQNAWSALDIGQVSVPITPVGGLVDKTAVTQTNYASWTDPNNGGGINQYTNVTWLLPLDAQTVLLSNLNGGTSFTNWVWYIADGMGVENGSSAALAASSSTTPIPSVTTSAGNINTNWTMTNLLDPYLLLDPSLVTRTAANQQGVNQCVGASTDSNGALYSLYCDIQYSPLYLQPK